MDPTSRFHVIPTKTIIVSYLISELFGIAAKLKLEAHFAKSSSSFV